MLFDAGGASNDLFSGIKKIGQATGKSAKKKGKKSTGSGVGRGVGNVAKGVKGVGRSFNNSSSSRNKSSNGRNRYAPGYTGSASRGRPSAGSTGSGMVTPVAPAPKPPQLTPEQWLSKDTTYKGQQNSDQKALQDYLANYNSELQKYGNEYQAGVDKVGVERTTGATNLQDDYASRGLLNSGVYGDALQKFNTDYDTRLADMERAKKAYEGDLLADKNTWTGTQTELLNQAKQEALQRRLAAYGL